MPVHPSESNLLASRFQLAIEKISSIQWCCPARGEHQSLRVQPRRFAASQNLDSPVTQRHCSFTPPCLWIIKFAIIDGLPNSNTADFEINIVPTESKQFSDAKTGQSEQPRK